MGGRQIIVWQDIAHIAGVATFATDAALHTRRLNDTHLPGLVVAWGGAQGQLCIAGRANGDVLVRRHVDGRRRQVVKHTVSRP